MMIYLDAKIVIYLVENHPTWEPKAAARIGEFRTRGDLIATGDASRLECLVGPYILGESHSLAMYDAFFKAPNITVLPVTAAAFERAAWLRATSNVGALDALHLATAIEHGCGLFLTNDAQLQKCTQINVEILT
jgi:predicted nucleic acid-binding protein